MKISPRVCLTKQQEVQACVCLKTGIVSALVVPQVPKGSKGEAFVFEYIHPLSYWSNAQGMVKAGRAYLAQLEPQMLAGLILTTFGHYSLLDRYELSAVEANEILCTASKDSLTELLVLAGLLTEKNSEYTPALTLEWKDLRYAQTIDAQLLEYIKTLRSEFIAIPQADATSQRIKILNASVGQGRTFKNGVQYLSKKQVMASFEKEFEVTFKAAKLEIKGLILDLYANTSRIPGLTLKLIDFLQALTAGRNLVAMSNEIRIKLQEKLNALSCPETSRIAELLKACYNPYDIFAKADEGLDRASDAFTKPQAPRSLKEILEAKKLAANPALSKGHADSEAGEEIVTPRSVGVTSHALSNTELNTESKAFSQEASDIEDEEVEDLLDLMPDGEAEDEDEELTDVYTKMTTGIYASKDF